MAASDGPACAGKRPLFFAAWEPDSEPRLFDEAREICRGCPVRQECYWGAIERREPWGIWGGSRFPNEWRRGIYRLRDAVRDLAGQPTSGDDLPEVRSA